MTRLSDRLNHARGDRSIDAIAQRARTQGHKIDRATVARYLAGDGAKNPPDRVLTALAAGLDLDVRELRELSGFQAGDIEPWVPPADASRMNRRQRRAVEELIRSMVEALPEVAPVVEVDDISPTVAGVMEARFVHLATEAQIRTLTDDEISQLDEARRFRNRAVHGDEQELPIAARRGTSKGRESRKASLSIGEESQDTGNEDPA